MHSVLDQVGEYFTLRKARAAAAASAPDARDQRARVVRSGEQLRHAAETLWNNGAPAQALRLAREALACLAEVVGPAGAAAPSTEAPRIDASRDEGMPARSLLAALESQPLPRLDAEVSPEQARLFTEMVRVARATERVVRLSAMSERALLRLRIGRWVRAGLVGAAVLLFAAALIGAHYRLRAEASAVHDPHFEPARVLDGNKDSEWLLPDRTPGWLDLYVIPPRKLRSVQIVNAHMERYFDRASREITVELYSRDQLVRSIDHTFAQYEAHPDWVTIDVDTDQKIQRVRLVVKSWFYSGGGFAEVRVR